MRSTILPLAFAALLVAAGCSSGHEESATAAPVADADAAARAFSLFYRERVERAVLAWNRFMLVGDTGAATTIGTVAVARDGHHFEIVPGPADNNRIGASTFAVAQAYALYRSRSLALTLVRMLEGLALISEVTGHRGVTAREAFPGWTRTVDGTTGTVTRTRDGAPVVSPARLEPALEAEIVRAFHSGVSFTYRENPAEFYFSFKPGQDPTAYAITYVFSELPRFIRSSDCCSSLMRTPEGNVWAGAFWGNHNSRDNSQDLALGYLTALALVGDEGADPLVRDAAQRALAVGHDVGDLIEENGGRIMTVDEHHDYDTLTVSGELRPDGVREPEDLGSMSECPRAYLARAISTPGLSTPVPALPLPGSIEKLIAEALGPLVRLTSCAIPTGERLCAGLDDAYCGATVAEFPRLEIVGIPWWDAIALAERLAPGTAVGLLGSFQDDYREIVAAGAALVHYADLVRDPVLADQARAALQQETDLLRAFADLLYGSRSPAEREAERYEAALHDAIAGLPVTRADLGDFAAAEASIASIEGLLTMADTEPWPLRSDEEIAAAIENRLANAGPYDVPRVARYRERFGDRPPVRRTSDGYEAQGPDGEWRPVENPRHRSVGGLSLFDELSLCTFAPQILDCTWAAAGCGRADLDGNGRVDASDVRRFEAAAQAPGSRRCAQRNAWCDGADLDHTGAVDALDRRFLAAADGCWYEP
ncbi:MAG: hypothetical protein U0610_17010 [bacterium]